MDELELRYSPVHGADGLFSPGHCVNVYFSIGVTGYVFFYLLADFHRSEVIFEALGPSNQPKNLTNSAQKMQFQPQQVIARMNPGISYDPNTVFADKYLL